ncbi:MAG: hypothetical protein FWC27_07840, partial [Firmicutes bacterium]|nr:hypothetical protein [Bacillota bacterium]
RDNEKYPQYSQWIAKAEGETADTFIPLVAAEADWVTGLKSIGLSLLAAWRWIILLPLIWMKWL